ncbi:IS66 family insertion sequence element accessory protein TnpB [Pseudomonas fluorescens]|nr:IS66 family insertion sequence element accessory protein TnpB [Pseudomonas fluorescens]
MDSAAIAEKCRPATCLHSGDITVVGVTIGYHPGHDLPRNPTLTRHRQSELDDRKRCCQRDLSSRPVAMIRSDTIWLATEPMDIRADAALARVVAVFGAAKPHCAYLFANRRATRMKVLVHDGIGIGLAARRLN